MFRKNLTHKILPLVALFLLIFNLFFVSTVQALASSECGEFTSDIQFEIHLQAKKFFSYDHYVCCGFNNNNSGIQYIYVCLFNESDNPDLKFYMGNYYGWNALYSDKAVSNGYLYQLAYNVSTGLITVDSEKVLNEQFCQISTSFATCDSSKYPVLSNYNIYTNSSMTELFYKAFNEPRFGETRESLSNLAGNCCLIFPGDLSSTNDIKFRLTRLYDTDHTKDEVVYTYNLNLGSSYYKSITDSNGILQEYWYEIPYADMYNFEKGQMFRFELEYYKDPSLPIKIPTSVYIETTIGSVTTTDKIQDDINKGFSDLSNSISDSTSTIVDEQQKTQNSIDDQTAVIKEGNKNIFEKIGEVVDFLNPLSDKFFVKSLIKMLLEALKSLFIPSDEFFNSYFSELNDWFSDRFGFLYYPLDLFFDLCDRFLNINFNDPIINIPEIKEPSTNLTLIHATQYNFNSLLEQDSLKTVHDIYLIIVDAIIYVGLVILLYNKYEEVMTK